MQDDSDSDEQFVISLPDAPSEADAEYDGLLSHAAEWHALAHGVFLGFTTKPLSTPPEPTNRDVEAEPHYYRGGYILGTIGQLLVVIATASAIWSIGAGVTG